MSSSLHRPLAVLLSLAGAVGASCAEAEGLGADSIAGGAGGVAGAAEAPGAEPAAGAGDRGAAERRVARGNELAEGGDVEEAAEVFREAVGLDPTFARAHFCLGRALVLTARVAAGHGDEATVGVVDIGRDDERMEEALVSLRRAQELEPENDEYLYELGRTLHVADRQGEALVVLGRLAERSPDHGPAHKRLGLVYLEQGDLARAQRSLAAAEPLLPADAGVAFQLGNALMEEDPAGARDAFRRATRIDPTFPPPYNGLVAVLSRLGDADGARQAKEDFERWRRFRDRLERAESRADRRPDETAAQLAVADLYLAKERWEEAGKFAARALRVDPACAPAHFRLGVVAAHLAELPAARSHFEEALFLTPGSLEPRLELLRVCHRQGDAERLGQLLAELRAARASLSPEEAALVGGVLSEIGRDWDS